MTPISCTLENKTLTFVIDGPFDRLASLKIPEMLKKYRVTHYSEIFFDFSGVSSVSSSGLELIFLLSHLLRLNGGTVSLVNPQPHIRAMLSKTDLPDLVKLLPATPNSLSAA